jgi:hypothetical protein
MPVLPSKIQDLLDFCDGHTSTFTVNAAAIGLSPAAALAFKNAAGKARADYNAATAADDAKKAAFSTSQESIRALRKVAADTISLIKAFAESSATPSVVYNLAMIPMPATPAPVPAPGMPTDFTAGIEPSGAVTLRWKCANPVGGGGTVYEIQRKIGGGSFGVVGIVGARSFTDTSLPSGSTGVMYQITAVRSTLRGVANIFVVNFGVGGGGGMFIASTSEGSGTMKMAA